MSIVKATKTGLHVAHALTASGRPLCGGGYQAKSARWQNDIGEPSCKRCAAILQRRVDRSEIGNRKSAIVNSP